MQFQILEDSFFAPSKDQFVKKKKTSLFGLISLSSSLLRTYIFFCLLLSSVLRHLLVFP